MTGPLRNNANYGEPDKLMLDHFPDIPGLSLEQRADIGVILTKEQKENGKQMQKKRQLLEEKKNPFISEKKQRKIQKNIEKADRNIERQIDKSNKKIRKILSEEQYRIFIKKRSEFQFREFPVSPRFNRNPNGQTGGERPDRPGGGRPGGRRP
jgi:hypothetical protein